MKASWVGLLLLMSFRATVSFGQTPVDEEGKIILKAFSEHGVPAPQLGWVLPSGDLVTEIDSKQVTVLGEKIEARVVLQTGVISAKTAIAFVKKNEVDCDQYDSEKPVPLYRYDAKLPHSKFASRVFVLPGDQSKTVRAGFVDYKPSEAQATPVWRAMRYRIGEKRILKAVRQGDRNFVYSFASTYGKDGNLKRQGKFLQDASGLILGQFIEDMNEDTLCDGCGMPTYAEDVKSLYTPAMNLVSIKGLNFPLILEDSGTVEGRAIDLFTFAAKGQPSEYRQYEYVVTCILGNEPK